MNKLTLAAQAFLDSIKTTLLSVGRRFCGILRRDSYHDHRGPQWQQLELPFSRTQVRRWNR